jgi:phosphoribosylformylglycinamidine synthase
LEKGFDVDLSKVHSREDALGPAELMVSESQERMLLVTDLKGLKSMKNILKKYGLKFSIIGRVKDHRDLVLRVRGEVVGKMPSALVSHAPLALRRSARPQYINELMKGTIAPAIPDLKKVLLAMISCPTIASKSWVYEQYDYEVGTRTVIKPGWSDASVLRLPNNKFVSVKLEGN